MYYNATQRTPNPSLQPLDSNARLPPPKPPDKLEHPGQGDDQRCRDGHEHDDDDRGEESDERLGDDEVVEALVRDVVCKHELV